MAKIFVRLFLLTMVVITIHCNLTPLNNPKSPNIYYTLNDKPTAVFPQYYDIPVYIDKNFTKDEDQQIHQALVNWNYALNGYTEYRVESYNFDLDIDVIKYIERTKNGLVILKIDQYNTILAKLKMTTSVLAFVPVIGSNYVYIITDRVYSNKCDLQSITMHEIGHTQGAVHRVEDRQNLMFPNANGVQCVDKETTTQIAELHNYDILHMNYCFRDKE